MFHIKKLLAANLVLASALTWAQDKPVTFKFSHWVPPQHPVHAGIVDWGKAVEAESKGSIKVRIFPAEQLGKAKDHFDMAKDGIVEAAFFSPGYAPGRFPILGASELPFMVSDADAGAVGLNRWYNPYADKEMTGVKHCMVFTHAPGQFHAKKKIAHPSDLKGMNIRSGNAIMAKLVYAAGGNNVQVSAAEIREVVERGTVDAISFLWNSVVLYGIDKGLTYHMDEAFYVTAFSIAINKAAYERLSPDQKKVIDNNCSPEAARKIASVWSKWELAGRDTLQKKPGHTLYKITEAERQAWLAVSKPLEEAWKVDVKKLGVNGDEALSGLRNALAASQ